MASSDHFSADIRSPSLPQRRQRTKAAKYNHFVAVNAGQLGMLHYTCMGWPFDCFPADLSQASVEICTKRRLYREAQYWPAPPTYHHRHSDKKDKRGASNAYGKRRWERRETGKSLRMEDWRNELDMLEFVELCSLLDGERERDGWVKEKDELLPTYEERYGHAALVDEAEACWNDRLMASLKADGWDLFEDEGEDEGQDLEWIEAACRARSVGGSDTDEDGFEVI